MPHKDTTTKKSNPPPKAPIKVTRAGKAQKKMGRRR